MKFNDEYYMRKALQEAEMAYEEGEIPVGAVIVSNDQIVAKGHNLTETLHDVTAHAEIQAITAAANTLGAKYLPDCTLYVSMEPCVMCAGAIAWAQVGTVVFGASDPKRGYQKLAPNALHPKTVVRQGVFEEEASEIVKKFFRTKR
ncbi:MAG TPA: nucleoside deaminase [Bacteroidaceae bacterium]|nr:nucleoside deaminase [Bacteroidaceae bacterium]